MRHSTEKFIEHGTGIGIDPTHAGIRKGEIFVAIGRSDVGKSVFNNDINSQPERFYAKANGAFLSEGVRE